MLIKTHLIVTLCFTCCAVTVASIAAASDFDLCQGVVPVELRARIHDKDIEEPEEDPDLFVAGSGALANASSQPDETGLDQGDVFLCAMPIAPGQHVEGQIRHHRIPDVDVFTFTLMEARTVELVAAGEGELTVALHDQHGRRLARPAPARDLRLVQTLDPGRYFLRLAGERATEGLFELRLDTSAR